MILFSSYKSPIETIYIDSDDKHLLGIWFKNQKNFRHIYRRDKNLEFKESHNNQIINNTKKWLDLYFEGKEPNFNLAINLNRLTDFQKIVLNELCTIEYGKTVTYGDIALKVATRINKNKMSAQAIGHAIGLNPLALYIPCHRVIGQDGTLHGYAGGLDKKEFLLNLEKKKSKGTNNNT